MSFGENLGYYRKRADLTQEALAEKMFVTRQTVSRWETDAVLPDVETLVRLCELFSCNMDTLVRGDAAETSEPARVAFPPVPPPQDPLPQYDGHMNRFSLSIALGVFLILVGVSLLILFTAFPWGEAAGVAVLLSLIAAAVVLFIVAGLHHDGFRREHPHIAPYPEEHRRAFRPRMILMVAGATALIFLGLILLILLFWNETPPAGLDGEVWEHIAVAGFMLLLSFSVFFYVLAGMLHSKYEVSEYNEESADEGLVPGKSTPKDGRKRLSEAISSAIMLAATAIFLLFGFLDGAWHPAWIAFPVGAILSGIVSEIFDAVSKK